jgi:exodeoxyribonuclease V gamma subunit
MPLNTYTGNRMENLVEALAGVLKKPLSSPLTTEVIVVQSKGMQRWVAMELAKRFGVWANSNYPFPNTMVWQLFSLAFPNIPDKAPFSREVLTWKIIKLLNNLLERKEFLPLMNYLTEDKDGLKRFQLADRIANIFDQYSIYRPEMLKEWEASKKAKSNEEWQAILWREIVKRSTGLHRGQMKEEFRLRIMKGLAPENKLPERICVFGISYLPQYHMEILSSIVRFTEVNLFLLSPTREYWSDIVSRREKALLKPEVSALRVEGNPLLASMGKLGRDFSDMVIEISDVAAGQSDLYEDPAGPSLLSKVQSDILNLSGAEDGTEKRLIGKDDLSVQIHSCHSPMREIEVLYDNLLHLFETIDGLQPRDILVMTPDIEIYAPYIAAVFDGCQDPSLRIPYAIADRKIKNEGQIAAVLLKLLDLPGSRFTAVQVFDILTAMPVRRRFNLNDEEIETIRNWIKETSIRWGIDEQSRSRLGLPGYRDNSWRAGLDRLLLGYAMPDENGQLFNDKLPFDDMEGSHAQALGKLVDYINKVATFTEDINRPRTLKEWTETCRALLEDFISADDDMAHELSTLHDVVSTIAELAEQAGFDEKVDIRVIRAWLSARLDEEEKGVGFMTGGVTFCAMLPMRSIPFRVIALIGMSDGAFPRRNPSIGFDLMARNPRRGDRSLRDEDRYLFLESILSARDCLYISYVGQSIKDNSDITPSVLVSELLDAVGRGFKTSDSDPLAKRLVTKHRLQAFSRSYFTGESPLFSYSKENYSALLEKQSGMKDSAVFLSTPLPAPPDDWKEIPLTKLLRFFDNPAKYFLDSRLGIRLEDEDSPLEEREPFSVEGLELYALKKDLLEIILRGGNVRDFLAIARCRGMIPPSRHGEIIFDDTCKEVNAFAQAVEEKTSISKPLPPIDFDIEVAGFRLTGRLDGIREDRMIRYRCAKLKAKDQLRAWIEHVVLNVKQEKDYPRQTLLMMTDGSETYSPLENAEDILKNILETYWKGLSAPLRFFPACAMAYAQKKEWSIKKALGQWDDGYNDLQGEGSDRYYNLCFGRNNPLNDEFESLARSLLEPFVQHQSRHK